MQKTKKGWCKLNSKTYQFLQCSISNLHIFAEAPKSVLGTEHTNTGSSRQHQQVSAWNPAPGDISKGSCTAIPLIFSPTKSMLWVCFVFFVCFLPFFLQSIPQPQMHFIEFLPCMFFSCHEVFETWLARLNIFYSCLYINLSFFKSYPMALSFSIGFQTPHQPPVAQ